MKVLECFRIINFRLFVVIDVLPESSLVLRRSFIKQLANFYNWVGQEDLPFLHLGAVPLGPEFFPKLYQLLPLVGIEVLERVDLLSELPTHADDAYLPQDLQARGFVKVRETRFD